MLEYRLVPIVRWVGRVLSVLLLGTVAAFVIGERGPNPFTMPPQELALMAAFATMLVGLAVAWIWEGWGGLLIVSGFAAFAVLDGGLPAAAMTNPLWLILLAGLLFLLARWRTPQAEFLSRGGLGSKIRGTLQRWFYRAALPLVWLTTALVSWYHPGDEYGLFIVSCLPAVWILPFVNATRCRGVLPILAAGFVIMGLAGWLMDHLRIWRTVWVTVFVGAAIVWTLFALNEFPSYQRAMAKNGSLTAYVSAATNLSLYLSVIATVVGALVTPLYGWRK